MDSFYTDIDIGSTMGQFALLMSRGAGFYPDIQATTSIAQMLNSRFLAKGYNLDDCDVYTIYAEIITILTEVAQASNFDKGDNYEC